jgi:serine O-acetyltransferase
MFDYIRTDIARATRKTTGVMRLGTMVFNTGIHAVFLYRLSRWFHLHHMQPIAILITYFNGFLTGAQISPRATIGKGLIIYHPQGVVIGATTVIGDFCTLVHGNVIGQLHGDDDRPIIGNHFYAGTGAKMLGKIRIGDNVSVGPNAVVIRSVPDGVTVAPTAARIYFTPSTSVTAEKIKSCSREALVERLLPLVTSTVGMDIRGEVIDENTQLLGNGIGLDSVEMVKLVCAIEGEFHLTIEERELEAWHFQTVGSLANFIQERLSS